MSFVALLAPFALPQDSASRLSAIQANLNNITQSFKQLPVQAQNALPNQRRLVSLAGVLSQMAPRLAKIPAGQNFRAGVDQELPSDANSLALVNNPARDLRFSPFVGYTQHESSTARCGNNVVVSFNDSAAVLETLAMGSGGVSFSGVSVSHNGGTTFRDLGFVPPGPNVNDILVARTSVACSDPSTFYLVQDFETTDELGNPTSAIAISISLDGGDTWGNPGVVVTADTNPDTLDDPFVAVDPSNPARIYISYRKVAEVPATCGFLTTVEVVSSQDGGHSFSTPVVLDSQCFAQNFSLDLGTRMAISSHGKVYVAWENDILFTTLIPQVIEVGSFTPGAPPNPPVVVEGIFQGGLEILEVNAGFGLGSADDDTALQGGFQDLRGFDLAVDRSGGPADGNVYLVWDDGRNATAPEFEDDFLGLYNFTDIRFSRSSDGQTFTPSTQVNADLQPTSARGHDHFMPTMAVDPTGKVAVCWYDRSNDPQNYQFDRVCAESTTAGSSWSQFHAKGTLSTPSRGQDLILGGDDMGHYDNLTTDFSGNHPGFIGAFQWMSSGMNPDLKSVRFQ